MKTILIALALLVSVASPAAAQWGHPYHHHRQQPFSYTYMHLPALGGATLIDAQGAPPMMASPYFGGFAPAPYYAPPQQTSWWWFRW